MHRESHLLTIAAVVFLLYSPHVIGGVLQFGEPYKVVEVNSPWGDKSPSLSPDGLELYFDQYVSTADLWGARRETRLDSFGTPEPLVSVNSVRSDANPNIGGDGLTLIFDSRRFGSTGSKDIWSTTRISQDAPWQTPVKLGPTINTRDWEGRPSVSADGLVMVFDRAHERLGRSLHIVTRPSVNDAFGTPVQLDDRFIDGSSPGLSADGLTLFFARAEESSTMLFESSTLWVAIRDNRDEAFNDPTPLDDVINTFGDVFDPEPSFDGKSLFFVRTSLISGSAALREAEMWAVSIVPEPSLAVLLGVGLLGILVFGSRQSLHSQRMIGLEE